MVRMMRPRCGHTTGGQRCLFFLSQEIFPVRQESVTPAETDLCRGFAFFRSQFDGLDLTKQCALVLLKETHRLERLVGEACKAEDVAFRELERSVAGEIEAED